MRPTDNNTSGYRTAINHYDHHNAYLELVAQRSELLHGDSLAPSNEDREHVRDAVLQEGTKVAASKRLADVYETVGENRVVADKMSEEEDVRWTEREREGERSKDREVQ